MYNMANGMVLISFDLYVHPTDSEKAAANHNRWDCHKVILKYGQDGKALLKYAKFPEVMIYACTEINQAEEEITVPSQRIYTGAKPVISATLANTPCTTFGLRGLLEQLNDTLRTSYTLEILTLSSLLEDCITNKYDFGTVYTSLHAAWHTEDWSLIPSDYANVKRWTERCNKLHCMEIILCSHKYTLSGYGIYIVIMSYQHGAQVENTRMQYPMLGLMRRTSWTCGHQWPISIPKDADLNLIQIEMLNIGLEYVWLDVLCLRQKGGLREDLCVEEWMLDVPTIGQVYRVVKVYCYLSGLVRMLAVTEDYLDSDRCWFNHVWTLQEVAHQNHEFCGVTPDGPLDTKPYKDGNHANESLMRFPQKLHCLKQAFHETFEVLEVMRCRESTNPVDKIMGIAFLLGPCTILAYHES
ncbi:hypothetical protein ARMGADRAFT_1035862 [Armillaria gallica]|uniref:Heterokaryon incompatibility domain-containing protein n=1 Tax=Armillaria gallica TaxID=47427 RepID=A0A2H3CWE2_ARMGA|nr:hypothetical protein ARMGADRAFT_1035862 [Armillaria gallica]